MVVGSHSGVAAAVLAMAGSRVVRRRLFVDVTALGRCPARRLTPHRSLRRRDALECPDDRRRQPERFERADRIRANAAVLRPGRRRRVVQREPRSDLGVGVCGCRSHRWSPAHEQRTVAACSSATTRAATRRRRAHDLAGGLAGRDDRRPPRGPRAVALAVSAPHTRKSWRSSVR